MAQQIIRSIGSDGLEVLSNILNKNTGKAIEYKEVLTGVTDQDVIDGKGDPFDVYIKQSGKYYIMTEYLDKGKLFLEKDTMAQMRAITSAEIILLKIGYNKGVKLNGYYGKGDTPSPIEYFLSETNNVDDGGSVIEVGDIKLEHDFKGKINTAYFGVITDSSTDNTSIIQKAIQGLDIIGGTVENPLGSFFNISSLTFPIKLNLKFFKTDDQSRPSLIVSATNELVSFIANANVGGIVNEEQISASFHPSHIIDVRDDVEGQDSFLGSGQSRENPARASYNIRRQGMNKFRIVYQHSKDRTLSIANGTSFAPWRTEITLNGINQASFVNTIVPGDLIKGVDSKGYGIIKSIESDSVRIILEGYKFNIGERVIVNSETSTTTIISQTNLLANGAMQSLSVDDINGNWGFGTAPNEARSLLTISGELTLAPTRHSGQHIPKKEPNPVMSWIPGPTGSTYDASQGLSIKMDLSKADASRRLTLHKRNSSDTRGHVGAINAHGSFSDEVVKGTSSFNIDTIVKNGDGDYTVNFLVPFNRADYTISFSTNNPMIMPYVYVKTVSSLRIRTATTGTATLVAATNSLIGFICAGGDI